MTTGRFGGRLRCSLLVLPALALAALAAAPAAGQAPGPQAATLSPDEADGLVEQARGPLVLDRLSSLSPEVALSLARHGAGLSLDGLSAIDVDAARALALHGRLGGDVPENLDVDALLGTLADLAGGGDEEPDLDGLERLLADLNGGGGGESPDGDDSKGDGREADAWLSLGGLRSLSPETAAALALHEGPLLLDGVRSLSAQAAAALAAHSGELSLAGLADLPDDVRDALADHDGPVVLPDAVLAR